MFRFDRRAGCWRRLGRRGGAKRAEGEEKQGGFHRAFCFLLLDVVMPLTTAGPGDGMHATRAGSRIHDRIRIGRAGLERARETAPPVNQQDSATRPVCQQAGGPGVWEFSLTQAILASL